MKIDTRHAIVILLLSSLFPLIISGFSIISGPDHPEGLSIPPPESHERISDNVLLIILDGLPAYVMDDPVYMPHLANWTDHGAKLNVATGDITLTGSTTKEMSTGRHSAPIDAMRNWEVQYSGNDDAWHYAADEGMSVAFTGFYVWTNLFPDSRFIHETVYDSGFSDVYDADGKIVDIINRWIIQDEHDLMLAHLGGTDHAGHIYGVLSAEYIAKMNHLDTQLEEIRNAAPENWTVMITADHGMTESGSHAISSGEMAMHVNLLLTGAGVEKGATMDIVQRDIASIPLLLLDLPFPISADSIIPLEAFNFSSAQKKELETWNWEAQVERQQWLKENDQPYADVTTEKIEWDSLPSTTQSPRVMDFVASIVPLLIILIVAFRIHDGKRWKGKNMLPVLTIALGYATLVWVHYVWLYDLTSIGLSDGVTKVSRKFSGIFSTVFCSLIIFWYLFIVRRKENPDKWDLPWWTPYLMMAVVIWQPDGRMSPALASLVLIAIPFYRSKERTDVSNLHTWAVMSIVIAALWDFIDYIPRFFGGLSLQATLGLEIMYKVWPKTVYFFMPGNLFWALGLVIIGCYISHKLKDEGKGKGWVLLAAPFSIVVLISWYEDSWADRMVILGLLFCCWQMICYRIGSRLAIESPFEAKWSELAVVGLIISTWGVWPAMITLILVRALPKFIDDHLKWLKTPAEDQLEESCRQVTLAVIPWFLFCVIWTHFSLLTPLGLIEFNPSRIIITGGFFAARIDPYILWMGLMISLPLAVSCIIIANQWKKQGFDFTPALIMMSFMCVTNISHLWLSVMRPQVLLIVGFSTVTILLWIICLVLAQMKKTESIQSNIS